ncbi:hypothetical protein [Prescottella equi]|uniref:hypothetical protein n=1 Tax=Rhodococcus hoagii TaxID=43767 RepID=UPI0009BD2397|nr:hypothetical protein [Prescottella equi]OQQ37198.1 hypothetical protein A6409_12455 [Prescottella equi]
MSSSSLRRVATVVAIAGTAVLVSPALSSAATGSLAGSLGSASGSLGSSSEEPAGGFTCDALSTESNPAGWGVPFEDEKGQEAAYSASNVLDDNGSLELAVTGTTDRTAWYHEAGSVALADVISKDIGFAEKAATSTASFQIRLLGTKGGKFENGFTTLVWVAEPGADVAEGATHEEIQKGLWWSTQNIDGAKDRVPTTLAAISAANPNATVEHYGVSVGSGSAATSTLVDAVQFNGCITDFAKNDPEPAGAGSLGSLGNLFGSLFS